MNYTELCDRLQETIENSFTDEQLAMFFQQAEQTIYQAVALPTQRRNQTGNVTAGNPYLTVPPDFLNVYSAAVIDDGYTYMLPKDVSFIREAFPYPGVTGRPSHYGHFDDNTFIVGPTPDDDYTIELHFEAYPESIVTAGNTWLGDNFDSVLFNRAMVEVARFIKAEEMDIKNYESMYMQSMALLANYATTKLRSDQYRGGR